MHSAIAVFAALAWAVPGAEAPAAQPAPAASVTFLSGEATRTAGGRPEALAVGSTLSEGDVVETGHRSRLELELADGSALRLAPQTRLVVTAASLGPAPDQRRFSLKLALGKLWAQVARALGADSRFEIETDSAVAGVRGTVFEVSASAEGSAGIKVYEGTVAVRGGEGAARWEHVATASHEVRIGTRDGPVALGRFEPSAGDEWQAWNRARDRERRERAKGADGKGPRPHERERGERSLRRRHP